MTAPDAARIHLPGSTWVLHPDDAHGVVDALEQAARDGQVVRLRVIGDGGTAGELVVAPATTAVVVTGAVDREPEEGFPQR
jgi:hypothetical protein